MKQSQAEQNRNPKSDLRQMIHIYIIGCTCKILFDLININNNSEISSDIQCGRLGCISTISPEKMSYAYITAGIFLCIALIVEFIKSHKFGNKS